MVARKYIWPGPSTTTRAVVRVIASDDALKGELGTALGNLGYVAEDEASEGGTKVAAFPAIGQDAGRAEGARAENLAPTPSPERETQSPDAPAGMPGAARQGGGPPPRRTGRRGRAKMPLDVAAADLGLPPLEGRPFSPPPPVATVPIAQSPPLWDEATPTVARAPIRATPRGATLDVSASTDLIEEGLTPAELAHAKLTRTWGAAFLATAVVAACLVQLAVVFDAYFVDDDYLHLFDVSILRRRDFLLMPVVPHALFSLNALLATLHAVLRLKAAGYYVVGLLLHAINTAALFATVRRLTDSVIAAGVGAGLWGMSLMSAATLSSVSMYGQVLATLCVLAILYDIAGHARSRTPPFGPAFLRWTLLATLAASSFGTGFAFALLLPFVVWLFLPSEAQPRRSALIVFVCMLVPIAAWLLQISGRALSSQASATFLGFQGFKGGAREVMTTAIMVGIPAWMHLLALGTATLVGGPWLVITRPEGAVAVIVASYVFLALGTTLAIYGLRKGLSEERRTVAGLALAVCAIYGVVAVGKGLTLRGDGFQRVINIASEPAYHYLPQALLALLFAIPFASIGRRLRPSGWKARAPALAVLVLLLAANAAASHKPIDRMAKLRRDEVKSRFEEWNRYIDAAREGSTVYIHNEGIRALSSLFRAGYPSTRLPHAAGLFAAQYGTDTVRGRKVRFVEPDAALVKYYREQGLQPVATLLATSAEALAAHAIIQGQMRHERAADNEERPLGPSAPNRTSRESGIRARMHEAQRKRYESERPPSLPLPPRMGDTASPSPRPPPPALLPPPPSPRPPALPAPRLQQPPTPAR